MCSVTSDCSTVVGFTSCKELISGGSLTCQVTASCGTSSFCSDGSYCTAANACFALGILSSISLLIENPLSQFIAPPIRTVNLYLANQYASKQYLVELGHVKPEIRALLHALLNNFAIGTMFARMVNMISYSYSSSLPISVYCAIESDCSTIPGFTSCKELTAGGSRTCQSTSSCGTAPSCSGFCTYTGVCSEICGEHCINSYI